MCGQAQVRQCCPLCSCCKHASVLLQAHDSAAKQEEETAWEAERHESKYARTLEQLPATKKVCAPRVDAFVSTAQRRRRAHALQPWTLTTLESTWDFVAGAIRPKGLEV